MQNKIDSIIRFLLYVLIFWLPYSSAVIEICVIASFVLWVVKRIIVLQSTDFSDLSFRKKGKHFLSIFRPELGSLNRPIAFFIIVCSLSVISSVWWEQSWHNFITKTLEWFIVYFLVVEVFKEKKHIHIVLTVLVISALATAFDAVVQYYFTHRDIFLGRMIEPQGRATAGFKAPNGLGGYLTIVIPVFISFVCLSVRRVIFRWLSVILCLILLWSLILSYSRGAMLGLFLGLIFFFLMFSKTKNKFKIVNILKVTLLSLLLGVCTYVFLAPSPQDDSPAQYRSIQWRKNIWLESFSMIKDRPLLGHGINTYMRLFQAYRKDKNSPWPTYAHNCYIQLTAETGILGLMGFLWIIYAFFKHSIGKLIGFLKSDYSSMILSIGLLSGIFAFLVHSYFDTNFYSLQLSIYLWFMMGVQSAINQMKGETVYLNS